MRLFTAIPIPEEIKNYISEFKKEGENYNIRWTSDKNLHITLQFLGDVEYEKIDGIKNTLADVASGINEFTLELREIIYAPPNRPPSMIWTVFSAPEEFKNLVNLSGDRLSQFIPQNLNTHKSIIPHATIARFKDPGIASRFKFKSKTPEGYNFKIQSFELWSSDLTPEGAVYNMIDKFNLKQEQE